VRNPSLILLGHAGRPIWMVRGVGRREAALASHRPGWPPRRAAPGAARAELCAGRPRQYRRGDRPRCPPRSPAGASLAVGGGPAFATW